MNFTQLPESDAPQQQRALLGLTHTLAKLHATADVPQQAVSSQDHKDGTYVTKVAKVRSFSQVWQLSSPRDTARWLCIYFPQFLTGFVYRVISFSSALAGDQHLHLCILPL